MQYLGPNSELGSNIKFLNKNMTVNGKPKLIAYDAEPTDPIEAKLADMVMVCLGRPGKQ